MPDVVGCELARMADQAMKNTLKATNESDMMSTVSFLTNHGKSLLALDLILDFSKRFLTSSITDCKYGGLGVRGVAPRRGSLRVNDSMFDVGVTKC